MFRQPINPHWPPPYKHVIFLVCFSQTYFLIKGGQSLIFIQVCPQKPIFQVSVPHFTTCILRFSPLKKEKKKLSCSSHHPMPFPFLLPLHFPSDLSQKLQGSEPQLLRDPWGHCQECVSFLTLQHSLSTNKRSRKRAGRKREGCQDVRSS